MSTPKRHHTVPRVYLEAFTENDGRLSVFSKRQSKVLRPKADDATVRRYYYSQPLDGEDNRAHDFETKLLHSYEDSFPRLRNDLLEEPEKTDPKAFFEFLLIMRVRSPAFREAFELGLADYVDEIRRSLPKTAYTQPPKGFEDIWDKVVVTIDPHRSLLAMAHYLKAYCAKLDTFVFKVCPVPAGKVALTSDSPMIWCNWGKSGGTPDFFPMQVTKDTSLFFPLSRSKIVVGVPTGSRWEIKIIRGSEINRKNLLKANIAQLACAWDFVIGKGGIPRRQFDRYKNKQVNCQIECFDPSTNTFSLRAFQLGKMREKTKFTRGRSKK